MKNVKEKENRNFSLTHNNFNKVKKRSKSNKKLEKNSFSNPDLLLKLYHERGDQINQLTSLIIKNQIKSKNKIESLYKKFENLFNMTDNKLTNFYMIVHKEIKKLYSKINKFYSNIKTSIITNNRLSERSDNFTSNYMKSFNYFDSFEDLSIKPIQENFSYIKNSFDKLTDENNINKKVIEILANNSKIKYKYIKEEKYGKLTKASTKNLSYLKEIFSTDNKLIEIIEKENFAISNKLMDLNIFSKKNKKLENEISVLKDEINDLKLNYIKEISESEFRKSNNFILLNEINNKNKKLNSYDKCSLQIEENLFYFNKFNIKKLLNPNKILKISEHQQIFNKSVSNKQLKANILLDINKHQVIYYKSNTNNILKNKSVLEINKHPLAFNKIINIEKKGTIRFLRISNHIQIYNKSVKNKQLELKPTLTISKHINFIDKSIINLNLINKKSEYLISNINDIKYTKRIDLNLECIDHKLSKLNILIDKLKNKKFKIKFEINNFYNVINKIQINPVLTSNNIKAITIHKKITINTSIFCSSQIFKLKKQMNFELNSTNIIKDIKTLKTNFVISNSNQTIKYIYTYIKPDIQNFFLITNNLNKSNRSIILDKLLMKIINKYNVFKDKQYLLNNSFSSWKYNMSLKIINSKNLEIAKLMEINNKNLNQIMDLNKSKNINKNQIYSLSNINKKLLIEYKTIDEIKKLFIFYKSHINILFGIIKNKIKINSVICKNYLEIQPKLNKIKFKLVNSNKIKINENQNISLDRTNLLEIKNQNKIIYKIVVNKNNKYIQNNFDLFIHKISKLRKDQFNIENSFCIKHEKSLKEKKFEINKIIDFFSLLNTRINFLNNICSNSISNSQNNIDNCLNCISKLKPNFIYNNQKINKYELFIKNITSLFFSESINIFNSQIQDLNFKIENSITSLNILNFKFLELKNQNKLLKNQNDNMNENINNINIINNEKEINIKIYYEDLLLKFKESEKSDKNQIAILENRIEELNIDLKDAVELIELMEKNKSLKSFSEIEEYNHILKINYFAKAQRIITIKTLVFNLRMIKLNKDEDLNLLNNSCDFYELNMLKSVYKKIKKLNMHKEYLTQTSDLIKQNILSNFFKILLDINTNDTFDLANILDSNFLDTLWKKVIYILDLAISDSNIKNNQFNLIKRNQNNKNNLSLNTSFKFSKISIINNNLSIDPFKQNKDINQSFKNEIKDIFDNNKEINSNKDENSGNINESKSISNSNRYDIVELNIKLENECQKNELLEQEIKRLFNECNQIGSKLSQEIIKAEKNHIKSVITQLFEGMCTGSKNNNNFFDILCKSLEINKNERDNLLIKINELNKGKTFLSNLFK